MKILHALLLAALLAAPAAGSARDESLTFPIQVALAAPAAQTRLDPTVKLVFGTKAPLPAVERELGFAETSRKTNAVGKEPDQACAWAFLSAALELQAQARRLGGDAVVALQSTWKLAPLDSTTEYTCGRGAIMVAVGFRGRVVKLAQAPAAPAAAPAAAEPAPAPAAAPAAPAGNQP